jgi:hypothetical protein
LYEWDFDTSDGTAYATVNVGGVAPTVDAGGPYSGNQGENIALSGSASDPSGIDLYEWDLDDNGSYESSGQNQTFNSATAGTFTVGLRVTDNDGDTATDTRDGERRWCGADGGCRRPVQR